MACKMDIIVSDFDNTLFKRNEGIIYPVVSYLRDRHIPIYIVTYRAETQGTFIAETLEHAGLRIAGYAFAESRKKEPYKKVHIVRHLMHYHNIVEALDDDHNVLVEYGAMGIRTKQVPWEIEHLKNIRVGDSNRRFDF